MPSFRIATYNIHKCRGLDGRTRVARIAAVLGELRADFLALQEVFEEQARELAHALGFHLAFGEARRHNGLAYGNASLSRAPFTFTTSIDLTSEREPRSALRNDIPIAGQMVHIFNVHLGTAFGERRRQAERLASAHLLRAADLAGPRIILGDFNEWTLGAVTRTLRAEFPGTAAPRRAFPSWLPLLALDHIYFDHHLRLVAARHHRSLLALLASDHLPLVADLSLATSQ